MIVKHSKYSLTVICIIRTWYNIVGFLILEVYSR